MSKSKLWIVLALVLLFAAGVVGGVFAEKWWFTKRPPSRRGGPGPANVPSMGGWAKDLGLTAEQQDKIKEIFKNNDERINGLRTDYFKSLSEIRDQLKKNIDAVLTPEQRKKNDELIQKHMEDRRREMERRTRKPEPQRKPSPKRNIKKENPNEKEVDRRSGDFGGPRWSHPGLQPH